MPLHDVPLTTIDGSDANLDDYAGKTVLIVNVASKCGFTRQYDGLEKLYEQYADRGLVVLGFPCNQFGAQEPGTAEEIQEFCSTTWGVTFPLFEKVAVNGPDRHPLFAELASTADADGVAGDVMWNFEKFLVSRDGTVRARFRSKTAPDDPALVAAVEQDLAA
jgi:glutathione peroxidase